MKNIFLLLSILIIIPSFAGAQSKGKKKEEEKPPTQKEMEEMMKELQQAMGEMSAEDKKMMDSMGIKMPDMKAMQKTMSGVSDAQLKKAWEDDKRIVPLKDDKRISLALGSNISTAAMPAYIDKTNVSVLSQLSEVEKKSAASYLQKIKASKKNLANSAVGFWINGNPSIALYLMGIACKENPADDVALNNYASFLTSTGGEQLAIPILNNLNGRYPKNSSILNNLAQAWLGLGDIARAEKYIDSTIRIFAYHPQANMAKCLIEESKGNIPAAIAAAKKSIAKSFSIAKEEKLTKLGYKLNSKDINWDIPMPQDPMGLSKTTWPAYPMTVEQSGELEKEWNLFREACSNELESLSAKREKLEQEYLSISQKRTQELITKSQRGEWVAPMPSMARKAMVKLKYLVEGYEGNTSFVYAKEMQPLIDAVKVVTAADEVWKKKFNEISEKYEDQIGEGRKNPLEQVCAEYNQNSSDFLKTTNSYHKEKNENYLSFVKRKMSDMVYYCQYTQWPEQFELTKVMAQIAWLTQVRDQKVQFKPLGLFCTDKKKTPKIDSLRRFDDVNCKYISSMDLGVFSITSRCSDLVGKFDFGGVKIDISDNAETHKMNGSVFIGAGKGIKGPAGSELEISAGGLVEFDNTGITDLGGVIGADASIGGVSAGGADAKITVNTGTSFSGKGLLQGIGNK